MRTALLLLPSFLLACGSSTTTADGGPEGGVLPDGGGVDGGTSAGDSVLTRNHHVNRDGLFTQPALTKAAVAGMHRDTSFDGKVTGNVYAAPLYVENGPAGKGTFYVATESNGVFALDESTGAQTWTKTLDPAPSANGDPCGNIHPLGITGTPAIDLATRTMYLGATVANAGGDAIKTHLVHALSIDDGTERPGWPVDVGALKDQLGRSFNAIVQNQRSAVLLVGGYVYVAYGGHYGDCGTYYGVVFGAPTADPSAAKLWATPARGAGSWSPGSPASDGASVFATTGNSFGAMSWQGGEAVIRFDPGPAFSNQTKDYWAPKNWPALDQGDVDLGGSGPLVIDVPGATPSALAVALGKDGNAYLVDRNDLGGVRDPVASKHVAGGEIINVAASYRSSKGSFVIFHGYSENGSSAQGVGCPNGQSGDLVALSIGAAAPPTIGVSWCADSKNVGSPIVTTTDGANDFVVWTAGGALRAWDAETGAPLFAGGGAGDALTGVRQFTSPIAVHGRVLVGADGRLFAFKP